MHLVRGVTVPMSGHAQPPVQAMQTYWPVPGWNVPVGHMAGADMAVVGQLYPAGHLTHADCVAWPVAALYVPTGQASTAP